MLSDKSQAIVLERERGETLTSLGARYGVSHQRCAAISRQATEFVNQVELDLLAATKTGEQCAYLIPFGRDYSTAMQFSDWLFRQLRSRGVKLRISTRRASNGLALLLEDVTTYGSAKP